MPKNDRVTQLAIIGAGPGGYPAAFLAADAEIRQGIRKSRNALHYESVFDCPDQKHHFCMDHRHGHLGDHASCFRDRGKLDHHPWNGHLSRVYQ